MEQALKVVRDVWPKARPSCGLILGSGWAGLVEGLAEKGVLDFADIPGLGQPGVEGHQGKLCWLECGGHEIFAFVGRRHFYEGLGWSPIILPVYILKQFGVQFLLVSNSAGAISEDLSPGDLMLIRDHVNMIGSNPLIGPHQDLFGPRFPDLNQVYDPELREQFLQAAAEVGEEIWEGVYLAVSGPCYETPAEVRAFRSLGADAVGMSTVPEAMLAHAAGIRVLGLSCIANQAFDAAAQTITHQEVIETSSKAIARMKDVMQAFWAGLSLDD